MNKRKKNKEKEELVAIPPHILVYIVKDISSGYFCSRWDKYAPT